MSGVITSICVLIGLGPLQLFVANCAAGAILGLVVGMLE
jgi:hypothetical protein